MKRVQVLKNVTKIACYPGTNIQLVLGEANFHLLHTANDIIAELVFGGLFVPTIAKYELNDV